MLPSQNSADLSLADVLPSCLNALGQTNFPNKLNFNSVQSVVIILVDGLGFKNLSDAKAHARFLSSRAGKNQSIRTIFPSTTSSALATLATGTFPGEHGITGYKVLDPQTGNVYNQLREISEVQTKPWLRKTPLWSHADSFIVGHSRFETSGLTTCIYQHSQYVGANSIHERFEKALLLSSNPGTLSVVYIPELDEMAHKSGVESHQWAQLLEDVDSEIFSFQTKASPTTGIVVVADHGVVDVPAHKHLLLGEQDEFLNTRQIGGEPRCLQLYLKDGVGADKELRRLRDVGLSKVHILSREEVVQSGIYGNVDSAVLERLGDIFIFAADGYALYDVYDNKLQGRQMVGQHGGISAPELEIPLILLNGFAG